MDSLEVAVSKGKRMKRQRPPSPLWSSGGGAASSSSSAGDFSPAPSTSSGKVYESTEEDEDLAHCLILLAQGGPRRRRLSPETTRRSSKKYTELVAGPASSGASVARAGFYVYECKTCSRVFPSFQALGGHRASHKKPKTTAATEEVMKKSAAVAEYDDDDDEGQFSKFRDLSPPVCSSSQQLLPPSIVPNKLPPKIHECSICGSEFSSGQALGGHMRRHRAMVGGPTGAQVVTVLGLESSAASDHHHHHHHVEEEKSRDVLSLDLNLPAPAEDQEHRDSSKFQLVRRPLVLSSPALIDCHY